MYTREIEYDHLEKLIQLPVVTSAANEKIHRDIPSTSGHGGNLGASKAQTPIPGLVAAYSFDEGNGLNANDGSGNNFTGIISGATWTSTGKYGNALSFNGTSNWVTVADSNALDLTAGMTLEAWVFPTAAATGPRGEMLSLRRGLEVKSTICTLIPMPMCRESTL